jgi:hypothetical protein
MASGEEKQPRLMGFPAADWVAAGALPPAAIDALLAASRRGAGVGVERAAWLRLARLSPAHARRVWRRTGRHWGGLAAGLERGGAAPPPALSAAQIARARIEEEADVAELRRLAGRDRPR